MATTIAERTTKAQETTGRADWRIPAGVSLLMLAAWLLPTLLGYATAGPDSVFSGTIMNPEDTHTYLAKILQGYDGAWRYHIVFTPEPHQPIFLGGFYLALGHLARLFSLSVPAVYHLAQGAGSVVLLFVTYGFVGLFVPGRRARALTFLLVVFSAGLGWLLLVAGQPDWLGSFPVDFRMPEAHLFFILLTFPHIMFSSAFMLLGFWLALRALEHSRQPRHALRYTAGAGLCNLLVGILHPLLIYVIGLTLALYWLGLALRARRILWREGLLLALVLGIPAVLYLYYAYALTSNPVLRGWDSQREGTTSPPWPHYLLAFGPLLLPALLLLRQQWRDARPVPPRQLLLWCCVLAVALLVYAPLNSQRRFAQGWHVPLAILAALGLQQVVVPWLRQTAAFQRLAARPGYTPAGLLRLLTLLFLALVSLSNLYILTSVTITAGIQHEDLLFRPAAEHQAAAWLRENAPRDAIIFGDYQTGNYVAARAGNPVVIGHWAETVNFAAKEQELARFFSLDESDDWRRALLARYRVDYLWFGPREQALGDFRPETLPELRPVYERGEIIIYAVEP